MDDNTVHLLSYIPSDLFVFCLFYKYSDGFSDGNKTTSFAWNEEKKLEIWKFVI